MRHSFVADVTSTGVASILGRLPGAVIPFFIASWFGASSQTDGFFLAYAAAVFLSGMVAISIEASIVPFATSLPPSQCRRWMSAIVARVAAALAILTFIGVALYALCLRLDVVPGLPRTAISFLLEVAPLPTFLGTAAVYSGVLNAHGRYFTPAASHAIRATVAILCGFLLRHALGLAAVAVGLTIGELLRLLVIRHVALTLAPAVSDSECDAGTPIRTRRILQAVMWQALAMATLGLAPLINRLAVATLGPGSISIVEYAEKLWFIPVTLGVAGIMPVVLTRWSVARGRMSASAFRQYVLKTHVIVITLGIVVGAVVFTASGLLTGVALARGTVRSDTITQVQLLLGYYAPLVPLYWANALLERIQIVIVQNRQLFVSGLLRLCMNTIAVVTLVGIIGVRAVPIAMGVALVAAVAYLSLAALRLFARAAPHPVLGE